jgi:PAS domain S-box-containing protein
MLSRIVLLLLLVGELYSLPCALPSPVSASSAVEQTLFRDGNDVQPSSGSSNMLGLTEKELSFKAVHPTLRVGAHHWPPIVHIGADGSLGGIAAEYLKQISEKSGLKFSFEPCKNLEETILKFESGQIDIILTLPYQGRADWILSSDSYFTSQQVLVTSRYAPFIDGLGSLDKQPVAVRVRNDAERLLRENYPGIQRVSCLEFPDCFELVKSGKVVAAMGALPLVGEVLSYPEFQDLKVGGTTEFHSSLFIGVPPRFPELHSIINKALASISPEQRQKIVTSHLTVLYEHRIDWNRYWPLATGIVILFVVALLWIRYQHRMNHKLSEAVAQTTAARELANELEFYFQQSNDLLSLTDTEGRFLKVNPQWEKVLGYTAASLEGTSYMDLVHPDDVHATLKRIDELREKRLVFDFVNRYKSISGEYRWLEWRSVPTSSHRVVAAARDVTELRLAQQERELLYKQIQQTNVELERFGYTVSHDLRSPLATIQGFASTIEADLAARDDDAIRESVQHILRAAQRMSQLMQGLLQMARLGKEVEKFQTVDLTQVLADVREHLHIALRDRQGELTVPSPLPTIQGDPLRLHELFQNLCENALKYAHPDRPPRIQISASDVDAFWVVHVQDNGVGIPQEKQEAVFEIFTQLDKSAGGVGVGLALVKRIVELHGGAIKIRSAEPLQGSIFDLYFPKTTA